MGLKTSIYLSIEQTANLKYLARENGLSVSKQIGKLVGEAIRNQNNGETTLSTQPAKSSSVLVPDHTGQDPSFIWDIMDKMKKALQMEGPLSQLEYDKVMNPIANGVNQIMDAHKDKPAPDTYNPDLWMQVSEHLFNILIKDEEGLF